MEGCYFNPGLNIQRNSYAAEISSIIQKTRWWQEKLQPW